MNDVDIKTYLYGFGAYAACLIPAMLPIFQPALGWEAALRLGLAAVLACTLVVLELLTGFDARIGDPGAKFSQGLLGISVCAGLYAVLAPAAEPQVVLMSLLWIAVGLTRLRPGHVLALSAVYTGVYLNAFTGLLLDTHAPRHADALYVMLVSAVLCTFMWLRAHEYAKSHSRHAELRDENQRQADELSEARRRIHAMTMQDMDTIALKYPFFKEELRRCKENADRKGAIFSIGLIEIDHFSVLEQRYGEVVVKQLLREIVDRLTRVMGDFGLEQPGDGNCHPLGRVGDGLYGMILPRANLKGVLACAERLHHAVELQPIRTMAGMVNVTLTIGVVEYYPGEGVDELLAMVGKSLEKARVRNVEDLKVMARPAAAGAPVKAAASASELRLLHYKEYESPVH